MAPPRPEPADGSRKAKPVLDIGEPELAATLEKYCDLRRRGFTHTEVRIRLRLKRHEPSLLLAEAAERGMPGSQENQSHAVAEWLLTMFDAGVDVAAIRRMSALTDRGIKQRLKRALGTASGNPPTSLIIRKPEGSPGRVSWLTPNGRLMHRAIDGAFPARYPQAAAIEQCQFVFQQLVEDPDRRARRRALTMMTMAEDGLHTFGYEAGWKVNRILTQAGMAEDAKRTIIQNLHEDEDVVKLLLQRCGIRSTWIASNSARTLSRQSRAHGYSPAITRRLVEITGHNPDTYYMIGAEHRIPEPTPYTKAKCVESLLDAGFSEEAVDNAMSVLGVPPGGHHPPKLSRKKIPESGIFNRSNSTPVPTTLPPAGFQRSIRQHALPH